MIRVVFQAEYAMKIHGKTTTLLDPYKSATRLDKSAEPGVKPMPQADAAQPQAQGDTVTVSQDALLLTEARRAAQNTPDIRAEKVEALRTRVVNGTYRPDSMRIAAGLVREEPDLFRA